MISFKVYLIIFICISLFTIISSFIITRLGLEKEYNQKVKLDIKSEKMNMLEERLSDFLRANQLGKTTDVYKIASALKISEAGEDSSISDQAILSDPDEFGNRTVTFKKGLTTEKKNFAYAHECAHLINGDGNMGPHTRPDKYNKLPIEQLADYTAAAILLPKDEIYEYLEDKNYEKLPPRKRVNVIHSLCRKYQVGDVLVLRRIKEVYELKRASFTSE